MYGTLNNYYCVIVVTGSTTVEIYYNNLFTEFHRYDESYNEMLMLLV